MDIPKQNQQRIKIWWDKKDRIIREKPMGDIDEEYAKNQMKKLLELANIKPGKVSVLTDMSAGGSASSGARKVFTELLKNKKIAKHAFFGFSAFTRVLVSFIVRFSGAKNVRYFESEEKALK